MVVAAAATVRERGAEEQEEERLHMSPGGTGLGSSACGAQTAGPGPLVHLGTWSCEAEVSSSEVRIELRQSETRSYNSCYVWLRNCFQS